MSSAAADPRQSFLEGILVPTQTEGGVLAVYASIRFALVSPEPAKVNLLGEDEEAAAAAVSFALEASAITTPIVLIFLGPKA